MIKLARRAAILAAFLVAFPPARAADPPDDDRPAPSPPETVRVEGDAGRAPSDLTVFSTVIKSEDFDARVTSVAELLSEAVGLHVRSFGGLGSFATVSIRGSTAEQVNVFIDGVLLNPALGGGVNLADLPLGNVESIEIYRGFTPTFLDSAGIGGAINIRTRRPAAGRQGALAGSLAFGSYDTAEASAMASWRRARSDGLVSFDGERSSGDFSFFDNNGTPFTAADDGFETRRNNRFWTADLLGRAGFDLRGGSRLDLQGSFTGRRQGVPGIDAFQSLDARSSMDRALLKTGFSRDGLAGGHLGIDLSAFASRTTQEFEDRSGDTTGGASTDTRVAMDAAGPSALLRWRVDAGGVGHRVSLLAGWRFETARRTDELNPVPDRGRARRLAWNLASEDEIHMAGGRFVLTPSARYTRFASSFDAEPGVSPVPAAQESDGRLTGRIGAAWHPRAGLSVQGNAGLFYREPSFTEIFGDQGTVKGGSDLRPEEGSNYDLGLAWDKAARHGDAAAKDRPGWLHRCHLEVAAFRSDADNLIQFVQTSQSQVTARNTGRARIVGAELSAGLGLWGWFDGGLNYTYQVAEDRSDTFRRGSDLPGRPRHEGSARAAATASWGRPFYQFDYVGPNFFDPAAAAVGGGSGLSRDLFRVPGRYLHSVGFTRDAGPRLAWTLEVDNLFDVKTVDVARYPLPGRLVQAKLRVRIP